MTVRRLAVAAAIVVVVRRGWRNDGGSWIAWIALIVHQEVWRWRRT